MLKVTKFFIIDWSSISNINRLIGIDCYRLISIIIDYRFHLLVTPGWRAREKRKSCSRRSLIAKWNLRRKGRKPWWKKGKNCWQNIRSRDCDAITVLNKIMDARSSILLRESHGYVIESFYSTFTHAQNSRAKLCGRYKTKFLRESKWKSIYGDFFHGTISELENI